MKLKNTLITFTTLLVSDVTESRCCLIDCYLTPECKQLLSSKCSDVPVECAMGTLQSYTLYSAFVT